MLVSIKHRTSVLGTQADGQTLAWSLGQWGDWEQGVDVGFLPICGCSSSSERGMHRKAKQHLRDCRWSVHTHGSGVGCGISLPQHFKPAVLMPRCSWNNRGMWYLRMISFTLCKSCLKSDCIKYPVDGVGFVFALKWINLGSHTEISLDSATLMGLHMELIFSYML